MSDVVVGGGGGGAADCTNISPASQPGRQTGEGEGIHSHGGSISNIRAISCLLLLLFL